VDGKRWYRLYKMLLMHLSLDDARCNIVIDVFIVVTEVESHGLRPSFDDTTKSQAMTTEDLL